MTIDPSTHVADLALEQPGRVTVFERLGIDYCCGGKIPLASACVAKGLDVDEVVAALADAPAPAPTDLDVGTADAAALTAHIVERHHAYLRAELPGLGALVTKVTRVHGDSHPELRELETVFGEVANELEEHMAAEETTVFPACVALERGGAETAGSISRAIDQMEHDHDEVASGLERMRALTGGYAPPQGACTSYRAMLQRLQVLEADTHLHVHKENNVLFPRTLALARASAA